MKIKDTKLGDIIEINNKIYIVCAYRSNWHVQVIDITGKVKLIPLNKEVRKTKGE